MGMPLVQGRLFDAQDLPTPDGERARLPIQECGGVESGGGERDGGDLGGRQKLMASDVPRGCANESSAFDERPRGIAEHCDFLSHLERAR